MSTSIDALFKRRSSQKIKMKNNETLSLIAEKRKYCKFLILKFTLIAIMCVIIVVNLCSPELKHFQGSAPRWIWKMHDSRYASSESVRMDLIKKAIDKLKNRQECNQIGLLNFNRDDVEIWRKSVPAGVKQTILNLDFVGWNVTWESLYPEWIDEEREKEIPECPSFPKLKLPKISRHLDLVAVKLPCRDERNWTKDVARLHLQLAAASVAASSKAHVLFVSKCFPIPNLFPCKQLVFREGNMWLYKPNIDALKEKVQLPVGACELALSIPVNERKYIGYPKREAYATILHSAGVYVCGAITVAQSIRMSGSTRDLVILVDKSISGYHRSGLEAAGWKVRVIERIRNPKAEKDAYNEWNYSKFRLWQLTDYEKIIFIDADLLVLKNIDFLFAMPEISATGNNGTLFNSGVMVIEPSNCTFRLLMNHIEDFDSYNGGDQGYLNEVFTWWHRIPKHMNFLKHFWYGDEPEVKEKKVRLFGADPPVLFVLHYLGIKPWLCVRDYDCNWNVDILQEFASDVAHRRWWTVHDAMPKELHQFCMLSSKQKAQLEVDRRRAQKANFSDGHWKIKASDTRLSICIDNFCSWKSMLKIWGHTNWTTPYPPPPPSTSVLVSSPRFAG